MSYDQCPQCGDDRAVEQDGDVVVCYSCGTPLSKDWLTDDFSVYNDYKSVGQ